MSQENSYYTFFVDRIKKGDKATQLYCKSSDGRPVLGTLLTLPKIKNNLHNEFIEDKEDKSYLIEALSPLRKDDVGFDYDRQCILSCVGEFSITHSDLLYKSTRYFYSKNLTDNSLTIDDNLIKIAHGDKYYISRYLRDVITEPFSIVQTTDEPINFNMMITNKLNIVKVENIKGSMIEIGNCENNAKEIDITANEISFSYFKNHSDKMHFSNLDNSRNFYLSFHEKCEFNKKTDIFIDYDAAARLVFTGTGIMPNVIARRNKNNPLELLFNYNCFNSSATFGIDTEKVNDLNKNMSNFEDSNDIFSYRLLFKREVKSCNIDKIYCCAGLEFSSVEEIDIHIKELEWTLLNGDYHNSYIDLTHLSRNSNIKIDKLILKNVDPTNPSNLKHNLKFIFKGINKTEVTISDIVLGNYNSNAFDSFNICVQALKGNKFTMNYDSNKLNWISYDK